MMILRSGLLVFWLSAFVLFSGASFADIALKDTSASLKDHLYWLKTDSTLSVSEVSDLSMDEFSAPLGRDFSDGYSKSNYWFRFTLDFEAALVENWLLEIPFSLLDYVVLFKPVATGGYEAIKLGDRKAFKDRIIPVKNFLFPIQNTHTKQTYFMYVKTQDSVQVPLNIWPEQNYMSEYAQSIGMQMAFFGAMLVMIIYNIFIFFSTRDKNYIFYVTFISLMVLFQLGLQGFSHQWLWPNSPWWSNVSIPLFGVLSLTFGLLFVRNLLRTWVTVPKFDLILRVVSYCMFITVPVILLGDYDFAITLSLIVTSIFFNLALVAIILLVLKGDRTAKIVLAAWSVFLVSGSISMLGLQGWLPLEIAGTHVLQIGSMLEVVLLSLALADRIKLLRKEKSEMEVISRDILKIANDQLEKSNRMKDAFIATISHEIKTPMNAILGSSQLLREESLTKQQTEYIDTIDSSGDLLVSILDNVLEYSKLEAGKVTIKEREVETIKMFEEILKLYEIQIREKPIRIWFSLADNVAEKIIIDDALFKHVIMNLISNAIKFTSQGFVWVHAEMPSQNALKLEVSDTGVGMSDDQLERIFHAFTQADESTSRKYGGTGLGLVISKKVCELMGGGITVESMPNVGTTFTANVSVLTVLKPLGNKPLDINVGETKSRELDLIRSRLNIIASESRNTLKLSDNNISIVNEQTEVTLRKVLTHKTIYEGIQGLVCVSPQEEHQESAPAQTDFSLLNVMAVDDDATNRMIIKKILMHLNVNATVVDSGKSAIRSFLSEKFDLILMDIEMPDMDGYETTQKIRSIELKEGLDETLIIALSAHVAPEFKAKALQSGMNDFFNKPVQLAKLKHCLNQLTPVRSKGAR
jgi:signal transduction histidine kinase/CheY-like chemotaxis protein